MMYRPVGEWPMVWASLFSALAGLEVGLPTSVVVLLTLDRGAISHQLNFGSTSGFWANRRNMRGTTRSGLDQFARD